ncbi:MAG: TRAP transporter substrate-binding protein DctP [Deltaproteobacteria bacterium]|nr:TRAP transporter substrate-binding protein DctP [Deltaproteobacteria bacterium]
MSHLLKLMQVLILSVALLGVAASGMAGQQYLFKVASLAPEGSVWIKRFREFAQEVQEKTNGEVEFKIYAGGVMGDDLAMYRKMKVGQLNGGGFTMTGIGSVAPDFRVLGIPFLLRSYEEVDLLKKGLLPHFTRDFADSGMELIALTEVGFIYTMSTMPISTVEELKKGACWVPDNDPLSAGFLETLGMSPTPLTIPDVLTSLQTGLVNTVFNSFYGSIVLQWFTKARYITDMPFGYAYGAFLLDRKQFARLPPAYGELIKSTADKHFGLLLADTRQSNEEARAVLQENGVTLVKTDPNALAELEATRDRTVMKFKGKAFSEEIYEETMRLLDQFRKQK